MLPLIALTILVDDSSTSLLVGRRLCLLNNLLFTQVPRNIKNKFKFMIYDDLLVVLLINNEAI
jgi:hypothetical protein